MKNEIKRFVLRTRAARLFALTALALVAVTATVSLPPAQAGKPAGTKLIAAANDLLWGSDLNASLAQAKSKNKYVLADIYTDWCGWCKRLDRDTFANPQMMTYLNTKFLCVKVNAENPNGGREVATKYKVSGYPCALVFDASGKLIGKLSGYYKPDEYQQALEDLIKHPPSDPYAE